MARFRETVRSLLRERLLDAAYDLTAAEGFDRMRMARLATAAGVSRQTVYTEFGSKEAVGEALFRRELERCLLGIQQNLEENPGDFPAAVEAAVGFTLRLAARNPLVKAMLTSSRSGEDSLLSYLTTRPETAFGTATVMVSACVERTWPSVDPESRALAVDTAVRLTASHIVEAAGPTEVSARRVATIVTRVALHREA